MDTYSPTSAECRRCGADIVGVYSSKDTDPASVLPLMTAEDLQDSSPLAALHARRDGRPRGPTTYGTR